ncbi:MAG TPA: SpoIIE family protein phosphatase [Thermoanaerobaculia bacterium]|nr:SpoIIE family protein phosphatase [Thermoanaerobaculia bacterium]
MTDRISREDAVAFVRAMERAANAQDFASLAEFYVEDAVALSPVLGRLEGRRAVVASWEALFRKFPDCRIEVSDVFTDGDRIAFLGTVSATDTSGWFGLPASGGRIRYRETMLCTMRDGRIAHEDRIYETTAVVERLEKARLEGEMELAADVQSALLSRTASEGPHWQAAGDSIASREIGGDFFEILELASGGLAIALGDVEGKGIPAALVGAMLHGMFVADAQSGLSPSATLRGMSRQLASRYEGSEELVTRDRGSRFATFVYGVLGPDGRFVYSNAGHQPPALFTRSGIERLTAGGPVLGAFAHAAYDEEVVRLRPGDDLLMFSDGAMDARNSEDEDFGETRLLACVGENRQRPPAELLNRVFRRIREFVGDASPADDITATIVRRR